MSRYPPIYILRHGETEWNLEGRYQGRLDSSLTIKGQEQADAQGKFLCKQGLTPSNSDAWHSPQGRAYETAKITLNHTGHRLQGDDRLCELSFGDWDGLTLVEITQRWPKLYPQTSRGLGWFFDSPNGEKFKDIYQRCFQFLQMLNRPTIIITHGVTSRLLRGILLGLSYDEMANLTIEQACTFVVADETLSTKLL